VKPAVLYLAHRVPYPPDKGDRIRTYHLLRQLARWGTVDLLALADEPVSETALHPLRQVAREVTIVPAAGAMRWVRAATSLLTGGSASEGAFWSPTLADAVQAACQRHPYRAIFTSASSLGPYLDLPSARACPAIVDLMDVDSQKWRDFAGHAGWTKRWLYQWEAARVAALEARLARRAQALLVVSQAEADLLRRTLPDAPVEVVANGVDLDYFEPADPSGDGCVFVGAFDYFPNIDGAVWFCREVWPRVRERRPEERLRLVGRNPSDAVRALAQLPGVEVLGSVPDVRPAVAASAVVLAPLRVARGIQNKVLEGLAMARPVLASPQAMQGLPDRSIPVQVAQSPQEWADSLVALLADPARRRTLGQQGRAYVERHHAWEACLEPLARFLENSSPTTGRVGSS
jgi:sugar transferase (PEP-CTERM/EpsH1 system associated)